MNITRVPVVSFSPRYRTIASCGLYFKVIICLFAKDTEFGVQRSEVGVQS